MHEIGLYHPRIHFFSDTWIKTAALYWTKMARIVPPEFVPRDSETVCILRDELDFIVDVDPRRFGRYLGNGACQQFYELVNCNHAELRERYGIDEGAFTWTTHQPGEFHFDLDPWEGERGEPLVAAVANPKLALILRKSLEAYGLAVSSPRHEEFHARASLLMHPRLARVYMSALAEDIARVNRLRPVTDDSDVFAVGAGWTADRMRSLLLPGVPEYRAGRMPRPAIWAQEQQGERIVTSDLIGMIAIQAVIPRNIDEIPVRKIVQVRERCAPQFIAFREAVDVVAAEMQRELESIQDARIACAYLEQEVQQRLLVPVEELRSEMRAMKIDTVTATLGFKYEVPALASLVAAGVLAREPLIAGGVAVAVGLLSVVRSGRSTAAARRVGSPASYLMLVHEQLNARSAIQRAARQMQKIMRSNRTGGESQPGS